MGQACVDPEAEQLGEAATFNVPQLHAGGGFALLLLLLPSPDGVLCTSPPTLLQPEEEKKVRRNLPL